MTEGSQVGRGALSGRGRSHRFEINSKRCDIFIILSTRFPSNKIVGFFFEKEIVILMYIKKHLKNVASGLSFLWKEPCQMCKYI